MTHRLPPPAPQSPRDSLIRRGAFALVRAFGGVSAALDPGDAVWARAIEAELHHIASDRAAVAYALSGCLGVLRTVLLARLASIFAQRVGQSAFFACCAVLAGCGLMWRNGTPVRAIAMQLLALAAGLLLLVAIQRSRQRASHSRLKLRALAPIAAGTLILYTALSGLQAGGVSRWLSLGFITIQPSLMIMPALLVACALRPLPANTLGTALACLGLALQGDTALCLSALLTLAWPVVDKQHRSGWSWLALIAALLASLNSWWYAPKFTPIPDMDEALAAAFAWTPLVGGAVLGLFALTLLPPGTWWGSGLPTKHDAAAQAHTTLWAALIALSAYGLLGTQAPLLSYGGSAVIGFFLSLALVGDRACKTPAASCEVRHES